jgi:hypothetical protein
MVRFVRSKAMRKFHHIRLMASLLTLIVLCLTIPVTQADGNAELLPCNPLSEINVTSLGEKAKVCFSVTEVEEKQLVNVYLMVQLPTVSETTNNDHSIGFIDGKNNHFSQEVKAYLKNWLLSNEKGTVLDQLLPQSLDLVGEYMICAILVSANQNVLNSDNWVEKSCTALVVNRVNNTQ